MVIRPDVGWTRRLIIRIVVVLPQPDGPTKTTILPAGTTMEKSSTAASRVPGYRLVTCSSSISTPETSSFSATDTPRNGEALDQDVNAVEQQGEDDHPDRAGDGLVQGVGAPRVREPGEDLGAEAGTLRVGGDHRDAHQHLRGHPHAGEDRRPGEPQLDASEHAEAAHPDAARGIGDRRVDAVEPDDGVPDDRQEAVEHERDHRRRRSEPGDRDQQAQEGERRNREDRAGQRGGQRRTDRAAVDRDPDQHAEDRREDRALHHHAGVQVSLQPELARPVGDVVEEVHPCPLSRLCAGLHPNGLIPDRRLSTQRDAGLNPRFGPPVPPTLAFPDVIGNKWPEPRRGVVREPRVCSLHGITRSPRSRSLRLLLMSVPARRPAVLGATRGISLAVCATALSVTAHRIADGGLPDPAMTVLLAGLFGWTTTALARKARGTTATIALLGAAQLVMHLLLTTLAGHHDMYAMPGSTGLSMVTAHAVATVLTALLLARADAMLLTVLAVLRAILPRLLTPLPVPAAPASVPVRVDAPGHLVGVDLRRIRGRRGPPVHS